MLDELTLFGGQVQQEKIAVILIEVHVGELHSEQLLHLVTRYFEYVIVVKSVVSLLTLEVPIVQHLLTYYEYLYLCVSVRLAIKTHQLYSNYLYRISIKRFGNFLHIEQLTLPYFTRDCAVFNMGTVVLQPFILCKYNNLTICRLDGRLILQHI